MKSMPRSCQRLRATSSTCAAKWLCGSTASPLMVPPVYEADYQSLAPLSLGQVGGGNKNQDPCSSHASNSRDHMMLNGFLSSALRSVNKSHLMQVV